MHPGERQRLPRPKRAGAADDIAKRRQAEQERDKLVQQLEMLSRRLAAGQEEERRKIAYELHEELGQELLALKVYLQMIGSSIGGTETGILHDEAIAVVVHATERIRNMVADLVPPELEDFGLHAAVNLHCERQAVACGWDLHIDAPKPKVRAPRPVERACYRVLQESLSNVLRHAKATEVWVNLRQSFNTLELKIRDNGVGFDLNASHEEKLCESGSLGLFGMRVRARQANGSVEVNSRAGAGTEILAAFPLSFTADNPIRPNRKARATPARSTPTWPT